MTTWIAMLRAVNVSGRSKLRMDALRELCVALGWRDVRTYIQSGNLVYRTGKKDGAAELAGAIEEAFGIKTQVIRRTPEEMRAVIGNNPFPDAEPKKLLVWFMEGVPEAESVDRVMAMDLGPEQVRVIGSEMFVLFAAGQGVSKLPMARIEKLLGRGGTGRNWNTVLALAAMAAEVDASPV